MTRKEFLVAAAGTAAAFAATTAAFGQTHHGGSGSAMSLPEVRRALEQLIDQLQRDQHDHGGWRVKAIEHMQAARYDIVQALEWDATHPH